MEASDDDTQDKQNTELYIIEEEEEEEEERKKKEEEDAKPKNNKTSDMKLYMRKYMSNYNQTRRLTVDHCEICDVYVSHSNKYKHMNTKMHKFLENQKNGYSMCSICDMPVRIGYMNQHNAWIVHLSNVERLTNKNISESKNSESKNSESKNSESKNSEIENLKIKNLGINDELDLLYSVDCDCD